MKQIFTAIAIFAVTTSLLAGSPVADLRKSGPCGWESQFRAGTIGCGPDGQTRGTVLYADGRHPRLKAHLQGVVWKGKTFHCDGTFTNRWVGGVHAISATTSIEPSWLDGQPCLVMQYPPDTAVFDNVRDELRQICPGMWLGRSYDCTTGKSKNWFVLQEK